MKISIAMATYNGARYLREQIDSLRAQTRLPDELVICDDRSTDDTVAVLQEIAADCPFEVRIHVNEVNLGFTQNFSAALSRTSGDIVFMCDQDDAWFEDKIASVVRAFEENPQALCVVNDCIFADKDLVSSGKSKMERSREIGLAPWSFVMGCCASVRRELLDFMLPIPKGVHGHDNWLVGSCNLLGQTVRLERPLQLYRRHEESLSLIPINTLEGKPGAMEKIRGRIKNFRSSTKLDRELAFYRGLSERLDLVAGRNPALFKRFDGVSLVRRRRDVLSARAELLARPSLRRAPKWALLCARGAYSENGVWVALKDLLTTTRKSEPAAGRQEKGVGHAS